VSIVLSNEVTKYASLLGIVIGVVFYWWHCRTGASGEAEIAPTV
jgi:hypothetical protein